MHDDATILHVAPPISRRKAQRNLEMIAAFGFPARVNPSLRTCIGQLPDVNEHSALRVGEGIFEHIMHWENDIAECPQLPEMYIPAELLEGLDRLAADGDLLKARLRWRPHLTTATGFLTKNRLLEIRGQSVLEVARALASLATHLHDQGGCEAKFEAQIQRELETPGPEGAREWRSITFYVNQPQPDRSDDNVHDDDIYEPPQQPQSWASSAPTAAMVPDFSDYRSFVELSRTDPTAFAMMVMQQSNDRTVSILERLLMSSVARLDRVLGTQISNSRYINEALQTLTKGANEVARMGVNLFNQGLEGQARVARMEHETELGKERTELMRDAVKHGSLLIQAVLMSNQAKQQRAAHASAPAAASSPPPNASPPGAPPPSAPPPSAPPPAASSVAPSSADAEIEAKARRVLELVTDEVLEEIREVAPSLPSIFLSLRAMPVTADRVRAVIHEAQATVAPAELGLASQRFDPELAHAFGTLIMRVLSEDRL